jgi:hypothetical protein
LGGLEKIRRFAVQNNVGVLFVGGGLAEGDMAVLQELWPTVLHRKHDYSPRKIRQAAVVLVEGRHGMSSLIGADGRLITHPLEQFGIGLIFCATRRQAEQLYQKVYAKHPSAWLAIENSKVTILQSTLHDIADMRCFLTYSRGVLGMGANTQDVRFLVLDAHAFRAISSFNPGAITPEAFALARAEERLALIIQNIGRALRGEKDKTVVVFVLNADQRLADVVRKSPAIVDGSELPPVFPVGNDLESLVDQARTWLAKNGGDWPDAGPSGVSDRRRKGRPKRSAESVFAEAEMAISRGDSWSMFRRQEHPDRVLTQDQMTSLKELFQKCVPMDAVQQQEPDRPQVAKTASG